MDVSKTYAQARAESFAELERLENNQSVIEALEETLANHSEPTDYGTWRKGSKDFMHDNMEVLKEFIQL